MLYTLAVILLILWLLGMVGSYTLGGFIHVLLVIALVMIVVNLVLAAFAYLTLVERKLLGRMQLRYGPNRTGPFGILQPIADGVKLLLKEDLVPKGADRVLYVIAPALVLASVLAAMAAALVAGFRSFPIPFAAGIALGVGPSELIR